jgi:hypothetical protein
MADPDEDDVIDIEEDDEGDSDDDSDDGVLFQQPTILMGGPNNNKQGRIPVVPPEHLSWQQDAILECLQLAVQSHDAPHTAFQDMPTWTAPPFFPPPPQQQQQQQQQQPETTDAGDQNELTGWEPKELQLPLPPWAADLQERDRTHKATSKGQ